MLNGSSLYFSSNFPVSLKLIPNKGLKKKNKQTKTLTLWKILHYKKCQSREASFNNLKSSVSYLVILLALW